MAAIRRPGRGTGPERRPEVGQSFEHWTDDEGYLTLKIRMPVEAGAPLLAAIDSLAEREARRERAQNSKARAAHEATRAAGGRVDRAVSERCAEDAEPSDSPASAPPPGGRRPGRPRRGPRGHGPPPRGPATARGRGARRRGVLADDTAAGRAYFEGGPAITGAQARRMLCEATAVVMLEKGREPLAVGRRKRRATGAQRRALLRREGGCARPGCPETRIERLHAHHMRHWLFGGRTELTNLVLLCDTDHGLVHDHDLVLNRHDGTLIVTAPDGRRVWGTADAAFTTGLTGADADRLRTGWGSRSSASTPSTHRRPPPHRRTPADTVPTPGRRGVRPPPVTDGTATARRDRVHRAGRPARLPAPDAGARPPQRRGCPRPIGRGRHPPGSRPLPRRGTDPRRLAAGGLRPHGPALRHRRPHGQPRPRPPPRRRGGGSR